MASGDLRADLADLVVRGSTPAQVRLAKTAGEASAFGYKPPARAARNGATWEKALGDAQMARNLARVNIAYGTLPTMRSANVAARDPIEQRVFDTLAANSSNVFDRALANKTLLSGAIEGNVSAVRDASAEGNTASAEADARQASFSAANTGLTGSSVDRTTKRGVLGNYLLGRQNVASDAAMARAAGTNAIEAERQSAEANVRSHGSVNFNDIVANTALIGQLRQAQHGVGQETIGKGIGDLGDILTTGVLYQNQGMQGLNTFRLPSLSGGSRRTAGGISGTSQPAPGRIY